MNIKAMQNAYAECALWSSGDGEHESLESFELHPDTLAKMREDCRKFVEENSALVDQAIERIGYDAAQLGHDFWLTRNGHGAGFWDRKALAAGRLGDALTKQCGWCTQFPEVDLYVGDDGKVYASRIAELEALTKRPDKYDAIMPKGAK